MNFPTNVALVKEACLPSGKHDGRMPGEIHKGIANKPPKIGEKFFISLMRAGEIFETSRVVKILSESEESIRFETGNSIYELFPEPELE
jgi:hypothetical protein